jgi:glycosyltransferase involved in cell wall biosynthesis
VKHPVTVVIPTLRSREKFLYEHCLPSVMRNNPFEIVIIPDSTRNANENRNAGFKKATQPYIIFVDDDVVLEPGCLLEMLKAMDRDQGASFAYSSFRIEVADGVEWSSQKGDFFPGNFDHHRLRCGNYINTVSLIKTCDFPGFDPNIRRYQDWDLWLTIAGSGRHGVYVPKLLVTLHQIDRSITTSVSDDEARAAIFRKHGV